MSGPDRSPTPEAGSVVEMATGRHIPKREDRHNEFKETFSVPTNGGKANDVKMEVAIAVAAFANDDGGSLFIGVNDDGRPVGLKRDLKQYKTEDALERAIRDYLYKELKAPIILKLEFVFRGDHLLIHVPRHTPLQVQRGLPTHGGYRVSGSPKREVAAWVFLGDDFYIRSGNQSRKLTTRDAIFYVAQHG